jgi:hypothetical protein
MRPPPFVDLAPIIAQSSAGRHAEPGAEPPWRLVAAGCGTPGSEVATFRPPELFAIAMNKTLNAVLYSCALLAAGPAAAHHSAAMFDATQSITLSGTVKEFQWMSPHCWIQLLVADEARPNAAPVEWGIEMDNPMGLSRHGWKPGSLKAGDKIVVVAHPLRDGTNGAQVVSVSKDGKPIGTAPPPAQ